MRCARAITAVLAAVLTAALTLVGCTSTVDGSGRSSSASKAPSASRASTSTSPSAAYPRTKLSTDIGDPATANVCAAVPLAAFTKLGYTAKYGADVIPPGCSVELSKDGKPALTVGTFGQGTSSFSHLGPSSPTSRLVRKGSVAGISVAYYAYAGGSFGDCGRIVTGSDIRFRVLVVGSEASDLGSRAAKQNCAAADVMARALALAMAAQTVPRLLLANPSLSDLDFCAVFRAAKVDDIAGIGARATFAPDGVFAGCQITGSTLDYYADFRLSGSATPPDETAKTVSGHRLYVSTGSDDSSCQLTVDGGRTSDGRYEQVIVSASYRRGSGPKGLCTPAEKVTVRFLATAGR